MQSSLVPSLPPFWYCSEAQFRLEKENIFHKDWIFFCHAQEIPQAGDYMTADIMGTPIIALRDENEKIQVLLNVCRHRSAPLLTEKRGKLSRPLLMCQYHGWCYRTDGTFKQAPFVTTTCESLNLTKISYSEARGMIFVTFNQQPTSFEARKESILKEMDDSQFKIERYQYHRQIIREGNFNWKVWVEGFQECYHCPTVHPIFNKDFNLAKYQVHNKDHFSVHTCPRKEPSATGKFEGLWLWMYPNCGLPCYENVYYSLRINPKSPDKTELIYTFFVNEQFHAEENKFFDFAKQITDEDIVICEQVQKNLAELTTAQHFDHGYLNLTRENGVYYFHELLRKAVSAAPILDDQTESIIRYVDVQA